MKRALLASSAILAIASTAVADPAERGAGSHYRAQIDDSFDRAGLKVPTRTQDRTSVSGHAETDYRELIVESFGRAGLEVGPPADDRAADFAEPGQ